MLKPPFLTRKFSFGENPKRLLAILAALGTGALLALIGWIWLSQWPNPVSAPRPWIPQAIVVLGGGNQARSREAMHLHKCFPDVPLIVTGDGGIICRELLEAGLPQALLFHEDEATSTEENARFTDPLLSAVKADRVILVSNWFHVPRALAVFRKRQPDRQFIAAFEANETPLTPWDLSRQRRERMATVWYLLRYGINSF